MRDDPISKYVRQLVVAGRPDAFSVEASLRNAENKRQCEAQIRKLAETYRPNLESLADKLAQGPLANYFDRDPHGAAMKLTQLTIRKAMQK